MGFKGFRYDLCRDLCLGRAPRDSSTVEWTTWDAYIDGYIDGADHRSISLLRRYDIFRDLHTRLICLLNHCAAQDICNSDWLRLWQRRISASGNSCTCKFTSLYNIKHSDLLPKCYIMCYISKLHSGGNTLTPASGLEAQYSKDF